MKLEIGKRYWIESKDNGGCLSTYYTFTRLPSFGDEVEVE